MGGSAWSDDVYSDRAKTRAINNVPTFAYDADVKTGKTAAQVHARLDPKTAAGPKSPYAGQVMREARDSDMHPTSLAIGVVFDETGSMGTIPKVLQTKLASLMNLLIQKGYVEHPQILFGAIGDARNHEIAPLQLGQFESGLEMEDDLTHIYLEGHGGGQNHETYEYVHYFFARHTSIDCFEKRGQKGYLFTIGDEAPYEVLSRSIIKDQIGDDVERDLRFEDVIKEASEKYHVFHIIIKTSTSEGFPTIEREWKRLLGERCLKLDDPANVSELIATTIGLTEGTVDLDTAADHLISVGASVKTVTSVKNALVPLTKSGALAKTGTIGDLPDVPSGGSGVQRL